MASPWMIHVATPSGVTISAVVDDTSLSVQHKGDVWEGKAHIQGRVLNLPHSSTQELLDILLIFLTDRGDDPSLDYWYFEAGDELTIRVYPKIDSSKSNLETGAFQADITLMFDIIQIPDGEEELELITQVMASLFSSFEGEIVDDDECSEIDGDDCE